MPVWTNTHEVPLKGDFPSCESSILIDKNIYSVFGWSRDGVSGTELLIFNTDTGERKMIGCETPANYEVDNMIADGEKIYIVYMRKYNDHSIRSFKIYELNLQLEVSMEVFHHNWWTISPQIKGNSLHVLEYIPGVNVVLLRKFDLSQRGLDQNGTHKLLSIDDEPSDQEILLRNDQLYMLRHQASRRIVSIISIDNEAIVLQEDTFKQPYETREKKSSWFDGNILYSLENGGLLLDTFDFDQNEWYRVEVDGLPAVSNSYPWLTSIRIDDTIFTNFGARYKWSILELELRPSLTNLSLMSLADKVPYEMNKQKIEGVVKRVPIGLRNKLRNMIKIKRWVKADDPAELFDELDTESDDD